ncbi:Hhip [Phodopus roborovskii]|uniref:Hhip protein n=1 Tax=Phodopus roborovskii TaxID=109678 RepID=A0AAV0A7D6_PHORO|nr:Hhip [Phodopus roborovskii]
MLKMLSFKLLLLAVALGFFEGDAKFGERSEGSGARRRRCLNGNPPKRLKRRDRRMMSQLELLSGGEILCGGFYPRVSCCLQSDSPGLGRLENKIFSSTNNTECGKLLEEIKCAPCSPHSQSLFCSPEREVLDGDLVLPLLCKDYCKEFFYTCRGHIPGLLQTTADEFCFYYARKDGGSCFPDFPRKQVRGPASNYLDQMEEYETVEELSRKHKHNCFCVQEVVSGLRQPVGAVHSGDGSHRLFILEKEGYVKILTPEGDVFKEPYLDIHKLVQSGIKCLPPLLCRCAVDRHPTDRNINLTILCSDSNGKNRSSARILQIIKGKDYESEPSLLEFKPFSNGPLVGGFVYRGCQSERLYGSYVFGDRNGNFLTLQRSPVTKQWQEKPLCLGTSGSCRGYFSGHILGFGEDELVTVQPAQTLTSDYSRLCRNGYYTPTGKCCCSPGWEGDFCRTAKCEPACRHGGVCIRPNKCLCKKGYLGPQCEHMDRSLRRVARAGILDDIIDMASYLLDLTSYIV